MTTGPRSQGRRAGDHRHGESGVEDLPSSWLGPETQAADSRFALHKEASSTGGPFARVVALHAAARAAVGVGLVIALGATSQIGGGAAPLAAFVSIAYAAQAILMWLLPRFRLNGRHDDEGPGAAKIVALSRTRGYWVATIGVDLVAFSVLHLIATPVGFNFAALLVLPVLMAGVLMPRLLALACAAAAGLVLLFGAWRVSGDEAELTLRLAQSGLAGMGFFAIMLLAGELAARLAREEQSARGSLNLARQQAQLNRLVIKEIVDGVMVVDRSLRVRVANPAARALLVGKGVAPHAPFGLDERKAWLPLADAVKQSFDAGRWPPAGRELELVFEGGATRTLRMRVRFTRAVNSVDSAPTDEAYGVLLLEDVRTALARTRQEKLAAMGRVSAGIAHEIRNPLAAISQANALLLEGTLEETQRRLARIVADNVQRLKRLVDDVMELAPGDAAADPAPLDATASVGAAAAEWAQTAQLPLAASSRLRVELPNQALGIVFDAEHLRRVLVNLLDNALRHASQAPGAIFVRLSARDESTALLQVVSDGAPIPAEIERHLFEPFFSTRSRGSGLGLYICRELCERYGASIEFRPGSSESTPGNEFAVVLRRSPLPSIASSLPLNP